jgi:photosystem II stability/assembly factor-like uncharacterized protein
VVICMTFASVLPAQAKNDLLKTPALHTERAITSMLLDVVNAGKRLVAVGERGHILYSDDGGQAWEQAEVPVSVTLTAIDFPSPRQGWAVGHDGVILHSIDAGESWVQQLDGNSANQLMASTAEKMLRLKEQELATVTGAAREELLFDLEDLDFLNEDLQTFAVDGAWIPLLDLYFMNEAEGFAIGAYGYIFHTVDGGANWQADIDRISNPQLFHFNSIAGFGQSLFVAGESGIIYRSQDGGESWVTLESPYDGSFFSVVVGKKGDWLIAQGLQGTAFRSADLGESWQPIETGQVTAMSGGAELEDGKVVLTSYSGAVLVSEDAGQTFSTVKTTCRGCSAMVQTLDGNLIGVGLRGPLHLSLSDSAKERI